MGVRASRAPLVPRPVRVNLQRLPQRFVEQRELARCLTAPVPRLLQHSRLSHLRTVLRDKLVSRTISRTDFFSRKYIRLTLPIMAMVISPSPLLEKEAGWPMDGSPPRVR